VRAIDLVLIPEHDGALRIKPTDGARQAFKGWATSRGKAKDGSAVWKQTLTGYDYFVNGKRLGKVTLQDTGAYGYALWRADIGWETRDFRKDEEGAKQWVMKNVMPPKAKAKDAVTMEEIAEAGRAMVAAQRSGDRAKIQVAQNAYRALRDQAEREENEHYVAVKKAKRNTGAEKEHQSMLRAMKHGPGAKAKDGLLSSPLLALAALLALISKFHEERVGPQDYDLLTYKPPKRNW
jgi:hypothetical protein